MRGNVPGCVDIVSRGHNRLITVLIWNQQCRAWSAPDASTAVTRAVRRRRVATAFRATFTVPLRTVFSLPYVYRWTGAWGVRVCMG